MYVLSNFPLSNMDNALYLFVCCCFRRQNPQNLHMYIVCTCWNMHVLAMCRRRNLMEPSSTGRVPLRTGHRAHHHVGSAGEKLSMGCARFLFRDSPGRAVGYPTASPGPIPGASQRLPGQMNGAGPGTVRAGGALPGRTGIWR